MITGIEIEKPMDMHVHLREGEMLHRVLPHTVRDFSRALVMPNTEKPIENMHDVTRYREYITTAAAAYPGGKYFLPLMTIKLTKYTTARDVELAAGYIMAAKLYPEGVTTNSEDGIKDIESLYPIFDELQSAEKVLCIHGEHPGASVLRREVEFLPTVKKIAVNFPKLRIVLEHVSTAEAVNYVLALPYTVTATITVHHLLITLDDVIGGMLKPHLFCKPIAKLESDRRALLAAAMTGGRMGNKVPKFFLGTDSAPHAVSKKECASGCAGVFTAPVAIPLLTDLFVTHGKVNEMENFITKNAQEIYQLPRSAEVLKITKSKWCVPEYYGDPGKVVPFKAGETLNWAVEHWE